MEVTVPVDGWRPRDYQMNFWRAMESGCTRAVCVWHRRSGKDLTHINVASTKLVERVGAYWHLFPNALQGRRVVWEGMDKGGRRFLHNLPGAVTVGEVGSFCYRKRDDTMQLWFANGSTYQVLGAENVDSLVGANPVGIIVSELSIYESLSFWDYMRPILVENGGWVVFNFTPRGMNHAFSLLQMATRNKRWFAEVLTVEDTKAVTDEQIEEAREEGMPEAKIQQEFYCSFESPVVGAYYGDELVAAKDQERICRVPIETTLPVWTWWDLGIDDATCIWWVQFYQKEVRVIDFEYGSGKGLEHYANIIREKEAKYRYTYDRHLLPHDIKVRDMGSGETRLSILQGMLGFNISVIPKGDIKDGIAAVRSLLPRVYFDEERCRDGISGLRQYKRKQDGDRTNPDGSPVFLDIPVHDWASNPADAFRTGAMGMKQRILRGRRGEPPARPKVAVV